MCQVKANAEALRGNMSGGSGGHEETGRGAIFPSAGYMSGYLRTLKWGWN